MLKCASQMFFRRQLSFPRPYPLLDKAKVTLNPTRRGVTVLVLEIQLKTGRFVEHIRVPLRRLQVFSTEP